MTVPETADPAAGPDPAGVGRVGRLAKRLAAAYVSPELITTMGLALAVLGGALLCASGQMDPIVRAVVLVLAAACIQLRLLASRLGGMVAAEPGGRGSPYGAIWNALPDRFADVLFLAGAGYAAFTAGYELGAFLGWLCAVLAVLTSYIRELGRGLGQPAEVIGPMAKRHRMFALTAACLISGLEPLWGWKGETFLIALTLIALGAIVTAWRRTRRIAAGIKAGAGA